MSGTPDLAVVLAKLATYDKGRHDLFLNPLTFLLKVAACLRARSEGNGDKVAVGLHQLSDHVNASRFPLRFLVGVTNASLLLSNQHDSTDAPIVKNIVTLQRVLNVFYNVVELKSYVKMVAPAMVAYDGGYYSQMACKIWFTNILLEFVKMQTKGKSFTSNENRMAVLAGLCDALLALNWCLPAKSQFLSDLQIGILGSVSGLIGFYDSWRKIKEVVV